MQGIRFPYFVPTRASHESSCGEGAPGLEVDSFIPLPPSRPNTPTAPDWPSPAYRSTQTKPLGIRFSQARYSLLGHFTNFGDARQQMLKREFQIFELYQRKYKCFDTLKAELLASIPKAPLILTNLFLASESTGHSTLFICNNSTSEYRFFDPCFGIFKFNTLDEMVHLAVCFLINNDANPLQSWSELKAALEVPLNQTMGSLGRQNGEGVCMAMTSIVARWFMDHPDFKGTVSAQDLALSEFEPAQEAYDYLLEHDDEKAVSTYLAAQEMGTDTLPEAHKSELDKLVSRSGKTTWTIYIPCYEPNKIYSFRYLPMLDALLKDSKLRTLHATDTVLLLSMAFQEDRPDAIAAILALGTDDKEVRKSAGVSALSEAIATHQSQFVAALLSAGVDPNSRATGGKTPLFRQDLTTPVAQALIKAGADVNAIDNSGTTPLFWKNSASVIEALLAAGARVDIRDNQGRTPIFYWKDPNTIRLLLAHKAKVDVEDLKGRSAVEYNPVLKKVLAEDAARGPGGVSHTLCVGA